MKNKNYYVVQGWMVNDLQLTGNELLLYAVIYGFSQDGENWFEGSLNYLSKSIGSSRSTVQNALKSLTDKGHLVKDTNVINGVKFTRYQQSVGCTENYQGGVPKSGRGGVPKSGTLDIDHNIHNYNKHNNGEQKSSPSLHTQCKQIFEQKYYDLTEESYYWTAKDAKHLNPLLKKLRKKVAAKKEDPGDEEIKNAFEFMLDRIIKGPADEFYRQNFEPAIFNGKFNSLFQQLKNKTSTENRADVWAGVYEKLGLNDD